MKTRFQFRRENNRLKLTDTDESNTPMTAAKVEQLGRALIDQAKQMKRVHRLRRLVPIRLLGGE